MVPALIQDLRYGLRLIRKAPGFAAVAIASLAVGIGASTVAFSFVNTLLFRPVHAAGGDQLIQVFTSDSGGKIYGGSCTPTTKTFERSRCSVVCLLRHACRRRSATRSAPTS